MFHGRSEIGVKYTGNLEEVRRTAEEVTELFGGFAVFRITLLLTCVMKTARKSCGQVS